MPAPGGDGGGGDDSAGAGFEVALLAIARDEGAYIAPFLFHHLRLGFRPIVVITNQCSDRTVEIVDRIAAVAGGVLRLDGDAFPTPPRSTWFQRDAYLRALSILDGVPPPRNRWQARIAGPLGRIRRAPRLPRRGGYAAFLDIDEFWVPLDGSPDVQSHLTALGRPDLLATNWVAPDTDTAPFTLPLGGPVTGHPLINFKSIWRRDLPRRSLNPHRILTRAPLAAVSGSGLDLDGESGRTVARPTRHGSSAVVHQMYRSLPEYLATLGRGRPVDDKPFKTNRNGYRAPVDGGLGPRLPLPPSLGPGWAAEFETFVDRCGLAEAIRDSQIAVLDRATATLDLWGGMDREARLRFAKSFRHVGPRRARREIARARRDLAAGTFRAARPAPPATLEHAVPRAAPDRGR